MKNVFIILLLLQSIGAFAQGLLNAGGRIIIQNNAHVVINGNGNWTNNGTVICQTGSWVHFTGNARQNIQGTLSTDFSNIDINNSHTEGVWLLRDIGFRDELRMTAGHFNLFNSIITMGSAGLVTGETNARRIRATDGFGMEGNGTGYIVTTRTNPSGNVGNLGLSVNLTGAAVELRRGHLRQQGTGSFTGNYSVFRYFDIRNTTFTGTNVTFNTCFTDELNGHNPASLIFYQWLSTSATMSPEYWSPTPDNLAGFPLPITRTLQNSSLNWTRVTLGSFLSLLPVSLFSFTGNCNNNRNELEWVTLSETNSYFFSVYKSHNALNWELLTTVYAAGTSSEIIHYSVYDYDDTEGITYYRLTQTDNDYSTIILKDISVSCDSHYSLENINVAVTDDKINILITGITDNSHKISITNALGQNLYNQILNPEDRSIELDKNRFAKGIYFISISSGDNKLTRKIVL